MRPALLVAAVLLIGCSEKPRAAAIPLSITLRGESPDGTPVAPNVVVMPTDVGKITLNLEILNPSEFVEYRSELSSGSALIAKAKGLKMTGRDVVPVNLEASPLAAGDYRVKLEGLDESGKAFPVGEFKFPVQ
jgi:hypothetical protein